ncbi:MAG: periplasmic protein [Rhodospirillales bacterium]|nr:periplasmic protein [Rhodospirillales bacterium]
MRRFLIGRPLRTLLALLLVVLGLAGASQAWAQQPADGGVPPLQAPPGGNGNQYQNPSANSQQAQRAPVTPGALQSSAEASTPDTQVRIGDVLFLSLPGEDTFNKTFQVDRRGNLLLPEVGLVQVAGLTIAQAQVKIHDLLVRAFRDVSRFDLALKERRLLVTVLGFARNPGPVELSGDATVQMAINMAGGLAQGAQLDRMQVRRGKEVQIFDYKKYLDTGDPSVLPKLEPLDEIFVPASPLTGNVQVDFDPHTLAAAGDAGDDRTSIKVFGEVNQTGSFAFKPEATIVEYIMRAGGVTRFATTDGIRVVTKGKPQTFSLKDYLDSGDKKLLPEIGPGTTIFVPKELEEIKGGASTIYVMGEVAKPGAFEIKLGVGFLDVLANAGGPTRFANTNEIRILKANGGVENFDLLAYTETKSKRVAPPKLGPGDTIFVPEKQQEEGGSWLKNSPDKVVRIIGAINSPGRYEWNDEMTILDLIAEAGGPADRANTSHIEILPGSKEVGANTAVQIFDLASLVEKGGRLDQLPKLKPGWTISIPTLPQSNGNDNRSSWLQQPAETSIYVLGALRNPGRYAFSKNMHFLDILSAADGPAPSADLENIRITHRRNGNGKPSITKLDLTAYFSSGDDRLLPDVQPGDVIYFPDKSADWLALGKEQTVRVLGSVNKPGRYKFNDTMTLLDLLAEAGGPTADAYQEKIVVVNFARGQDQAETFNLVHFAKTGNFQELPVLRAGDTVYVPNATQSDWQQFISGVRDTVSVLSIFALLGKL